MHYSSCPFFFAFSSCSCLHLGFSTPRNLLMYSSCSRKVAIFFFRTSAMFSNDAVPCPCFGYSLYISAFWNACKSWLPERSFFCTSSSSFDSSCGAPGFVMLALIFASSFSFAICNLSCLKSLKRSYFNYSDMPGWSSHISGLQPHIPEAVEYATDTFGSFGYSGGIKWMIESCSVNFTSLDSIGICSTLSSWLFGFSCSAGSTGPKT